MPADFAGLECWAFSSIVRHDSFLGNEHVGSLTLCMTARLQNVSVDSYLIRSTSQMLDVPFTLDGKVLRSECAHIKIRYLCIVAAADYAGDEHLVVDMMKAS